jgi:hypothetical protein
MTPVYFPYTYIPDAIRTAILSLFGRIIVYKPASSPAQNKKTDKNTGASEQEWMDERLPLIKYNGMIEKMFKDNLNWAQYYKTDQIRNLKSYMDTIPFFTDASSFKIKSEISKLSDNKQDQKHDLDFTAGLFLMYAEYLDIRHEEINKSLQSVQNKTNEMLRELKGENPAFNEGDSTDDSDDPLCYMIKERLDAWTSLMIRDIPESCLFLTANREVISTLFDDIHGDMHGVDKILDYPEIPLLDERDDNTLGNWRKGFKEYALCLTAQTDQESQPDPPLPPIGDKGKDGFSFTLYKVNGVTPVEFFSRFSRESLCNPEGEEKTSNCLNTLIGVIQL